MWWHCFSRKDVELLVHVVQIWYMPSMCYVWSVSVNNKVLFNCWPLFAGLMWCFGYHWGVTPCSLWSENYRSDCLNHDWPMWVLPLSELLLTVSSILLYLFFKWPICLFRKTALSWCDALTLTNDRCMLYGGRVILECIIWPTIHSELVISLQRPIKQ